MTSRADGPASAITRYLSNVRTSGSLGACAVETPAHGRNSEVFLITEPSGERYVLRSFMGTREGRRYVALMQRFGNAELPLPSLLWSDLRLATRLRYRRCFSAEQFIEGPLLLEAAPESIESVLRSLAILHDEVSDQWGAPDRPRRDDIRPHLFEECRRWIRSIPASSPFLKPGDRERFESLLAAKLVDVPEQAQFSLIHGKLGADDIVVPGGGRQAIFIDNGSLSYGHFVHDLFYLLDTVSLDDQPHRNALVEQYLRMRKRLPPGFEYACVEPFFSVRHHVKKLWAAHRRRTSDALAVHPHTRFHYERLVALAGSG